MPNIYRYGGQEFRTNDEYDTEQLKSIVDMLEGRPFTSSVLQSQVPRVASLADRSRHYNSSKLNLPDIPSPFDTMRNQMAWPHKAVTTGLRVGGDITGRAIGGITGAAIAAPSVPVSGPVGPAAGAFAGQTIGGGVGSGIGEAAAQGYEKLIGARESFNPWTIALEGGLGAIPLPKVARPIGKMAVQGLSGSAQAAVGESGRIISEEGALPSFHDLELPIAAGFVLGAGGAGLGIRSDRKAAVANKLAQDRRIANYDAVERAKNAERGVANVQRIAREAEDTRLHGEYETRLKADDVAATDAEARLTREGESWEANRTRQIEEKRYKEEMSQREVDVQIERIKNQSMLEDFNSIKSDIHAHADSAVEAATGRMREKWIAAQIANKRKSGKTVKQIREEAMDIQMNRPATNAVRVAAMRGAARELGLDPSDIDGSILREIQGRYNFNPQTSEGIDVSGSKGSSPGQVTAPPGVPRVPGAPERVPGAGKDIKSLIERAQAVLAGARQTGQADELAEGSVASSTGIPRDESLAVSMGGESGVGQKLGGSGWTPTGQKGETKGFASLGADLGQDTANEMARKQTAAKFAANDAAEVAARMDQSDNPIVRDILENDPDAVVDLSRRIPTAQTQWNAWITSVMRKLENLGGQNLVRELQRYEREIPIMTSDLGRRVDEIFTGLGTDKKLAEARWNNVLERRQNPSRVAALDNEADVVYEKMRQLDNHKKELWEQGGMTDPYLATAKPMAYEVGFWGNSDAVTDALKARYPKLTNENARRIANGTKHLTDAEEAALEKNIAIAGGDKEWIIQKFREQNLKDSGRAPDTDLMNRLDLPGSHSGIEAVKMDNISFAQNIAKAKMGDVDKLYDETLNPKLARELAGKVISFKKNRPDEQYIGRMNQLVGRYATMRMLGSYIISNMSNVNGTILEAGAGKTVKTLAKLLTSGEARGEARRITSEAGIDVDLSRGMLQELQGNDIFSKLVINPFWTKQVSVAENMMRTLNGAVGREYAQDLFGKLKLGTATQDEQNKLLRYTLAKNTKSLLEQTELTEKQLKYAAYGFTEKTQGTRSALNVSPMISSEDPLKNVITMFKRYSAQSTKLIKDSLLGPDLTKTERVRNFTRLFLASQAMGEIVGDTKSAIKGGVMDIADEFKEGQDRTNHVEKEVMERGEWLNYMMKGWLGDAEIPHVISRAADNMIQGWMFGTLVDLVMAGASGEKEAMSTALGPVASDVITLGSGAVETGQNLLQGKKVTVPDRIKRQLIRSVPIIGPGLAGAIAPTQRESGRNKSWEDYFVKDTKQSIKGIQRFGRKLIR